MASPVQIINARYQLRGKPIGRGGMGIVHKAYDIVTKRHVALKTMKGALNATALELFSKEWTVLAGVSHPNIVDVLDTGEFEEDGERKPFFVMPFLPGATLEHLIENAGQRLTVERIVEIITQTCRGLQAAHEHGLIHRDMKPSNIFVMDDDTVKIIDFGVVHLAGTESFTGMKGTLPYMAPEQIEMKPMSAASDIFSLGVVCYEAMTGRKPFARRTERDTAQAILRHIPPPVCELNPMVSQLVSRVIHKAIAKMPWHRFGTAREFADTLQKALKNQTIELFDRGKFQPRIERAKKTHADGDHQFASEILTELEAEGHIDPEMTVLRMQIDHAIRRKSIRQLLDSARTRLEEDEFPLALQKIQEVLDMDPENSDALGMRREIEKQRSERQIENWFRLVEQHIHHQSFDQARQGLGEVLKLDAVNEKARELLLQVDQSEQEITRLRTEKEQLYQSAVSSYQHGEVSSALTKLERVLDLNRRSPESAVPDRDAQYQSLYNQIRNERESARNLYNEGRRALADRNFGRALEICLEALNKSPGDPMFQALKLEAEEQERQEQSSYSADIARRVEAEPDLDRRVNILKEAVERYPNEPYFQQSLRLIRERRDLVNGIVAKVRQYEERRQFHDALGQLDILRNIYAQYPGLDFEMERLMGRRDEQAREEAKGRWVEQIDRHIAAGDYGRARDLVRSAIGEFPGDRELAGLGKLAQQSVERAAEAEQWLQRGQKLCFDREFGEGLEALRRAATLDSRNPVIRASLLNALVEQARSVLGQDWRSAEPLIAEALNINAGHPSAKSLQELVLDYKRREIVTECVSQARELQASGDLDAAIRRVETALESYPTEARLAQLRSTLRELAGLPAAPTPAPRVEAMPEPPPGPPAVPAPANGSAFSLGQSTVGTWESALLLPQPVVESRVAFSANLQAKALQLVQFLRGLAAPHRGTPRLLWIFIALAPTLLLLAMIKVRTHDVNARVAPAPPVSKIAVQLESQPGGASWLIDGQPVSQPSRLAPGSHTAEARLTGYRPALQQFTLAARTAVPYVVRLSLEPEPVSLRLSSGLKTGEASLDGQPPEELQDGMFSKDGIGLNDHTFKLVQSKKEILSFSFRADAAGLPVLTAPLKSGGTDAIAIASLGSRARVYASSRSLKAKIGDTAGWQPVAPDGLEILLPADNTELLLNDGKNDGKNRRRLRLEISNAPAISVSMADLDYAILQVEASVPDAQLFLNGRKNRTLKAGRNYVKVAPGTYSVRVSREGYEQGADQTVELKNGESRQLPPFALQPIVRTASLVINLATDDADVYLDGVARGKTDASGSYRFDEVPPGQHALALKRQYYEDKEWAALTFAAGQPTTIAGTEARLAPWGFLEFRVTPGNATVTYQREDEAQSHHASALEKTHVRPGKYTVTAAAGERSVRQTVSVEPGGTQPVTFSLAMVEARKEPERTTPKPTNEYFIEPESWTMEQGWWVHGKDSTSYLRAKQGVFVISVIHPTSKNLASFKLRKKRVEWVIDERDGNRIEYVLDANGLERKATENGKGQKAAPKKAVPVSDERSLIRIEIRPDTVVVSSGGTVLDTYTRPDNETPLGRFGFKGEAVLTILSGAER